MVMKNLTILYEQGENGWWVATIPEFPGAFSQGRTQESARRNVISAMKELMAARRKEAMKERPKSSKVESLPFSV